MDNVLMTVLNQSDDSRRGCKRGSSPQNQKMLGFYPSGLFRPGYSG